MDALKNAETWICPHSRLVFYKGVDGSWIPGEWHLKAYKRFKNYFLTGLYYDR